MPFSNGSKGVSNGMTKLRRRRIMREIVSKQRREFVARAKKEAAEMNKEKRERGEEEDSQRSDECGW